MGVSLAECARRARRARPKQDAPTASLAVDGPGVYVMARAWGGVSRTGTAAAAAAGDHAKAPAVGLKKGPLEANPSAPASMVSGTIRGDGSKGEPQTKRAPAFSVRFSRGLVFKHLVNSPFGTSLLI